MCQRQLRHREVVLEKLKYLVSDEYLDRRTTYARIDGLLMGFSFGFVSGVLFVLWS